MIDVHSHILNFGCCPDKWLEKFTHIPKIELILKFPFSKFILNLCSKLIKGKSFKRVDEMIKIFKTDLFGVGNILKEEMEEASIKLSIPLMMDLDYATKNEYTAELDYGIQIEILKRVAKHHYGKIMPFVGFDPRRADSAKFVVHSLINKGMLGIKIYPKLGFHPSPKSMINSPETNMNLKLIYEYCQENKIPITTHCSSGGAYSEDLIGSKEERNTLVHPTAWEEVLELYPRLYLNLGHLGGDIGGVGSRLWFPYALELLNKYENVYGDLAYNTQVHKEKEKDAFFKVINTKVFPHDKILFGTDWSMIRHTYTIKEYIVPFLTGFRNKEIGDKILYKNAIKFLFPNNEIPERIRVALSKTIEDTPKWLQNKFNLNKESI